MADKTARAVLTLFWRRWWKSSTAARVGINGPSSAQISGSAPRAPRSTISSPTPDWKPGLITTLGEVARWRQQGFSWELDVVPVVKAHAARSRSETPELFV